MLNAHWLLCKAMRLKFSSVLRMSYRLNVSNRTENFKVLFLNPEPFWFEYFHRLNVSNRTENFKVLYLNPEPFWFEYFHSFAICMHRNDNKFSDNLQFFRFFFLTLS